MKINKAKKQLIIITILFFGVFGLAKNSLAESPGPQAGSGPTSANLWVDTNGGTCTRQPTAGAYVDAQACSSMQAALTVASAGDDIVIRNGTYGNQTLSSGGKASTVNFYAQTYGSVLVGSLNIDVNYINIYGVIGSGTGNSRGSLDIEGDYVLIDGFRGSSFGAGWSDSYSHITVQHCEFGNNDTSLSSAEFDCVAIGYTSYISFINNIFHDHYDHTGGSVDIARHNDMISFHYAAGGDHVLFDGNIFYNGPDGGSNIMASGPLSNWTIQNNYFGGISSNTSESYGNNVTYGQGTCTGYLIFRNNVIASGAGYMINTGGCSPSVDFSGNISLQTGYHACAGTGSQSGGYNTFADSSANNNCASSNRVCSPVWLNGTPSAFNNYDIRLSSNDTCAKDHGNPSSYAPTDMYGTTRPMGASPDTGAYEIGAFGGDTIPPSAPSGLSVQ